MSLEQNPTPSNGDASTPSDPISRIEAFLDGHDGDGASEDEGASQASEKAQNPPDKPSGDEPGEDKEPQFTTAHLAQFLGIDESMIDVDADGQPVFKTKVDGKEGSAKFQDFLKDHQLKGAAENRVREAAEKEKAAERRLQEADTAIQARLQETQANLQNLAQINAVLQQELAGERNSINWDALWQENPAQARAYERRFDERQQRINGVFQQIQMRNAQAHQQAEALRVQNAQKTEAQQRERLLKLVPEWSDPTTFAKERSEILTWFEKSGLSQEDFDLNKASQVVALRRAWQQDTLQKSKPEVENRLKTAPRLVKPGQAPQPSESATAKAKSLKASIKSASPSESTKAFADYLLATGQA